MLRKKGKRISLGANILKTVLITYSVASLILIAFSTAMCQKSTLSVIDKTITDTALATADSAANEYEGLLSMAQSIASDSTVSDLSSSDSEKQSVLDTKVAGQGVLTGIKYLSSDGTCVSDGINYSSEAYFKAAADGKTYVSSPELDVASGELILYVAVPVWKDGISGLRPIGIVCLMAKQETLNGIVENVDIGERANAFIINKSGITIADKDISAVKAKNSIINDARTDHSLAGQASFYKKAISGKTGFGNYSAKGENKFIAYAPIRGTDGWCVIIEAPEHELTQGVTPTLELALLLLVILLIVMTIFLSKALDKAITVKLVAITNRLRAFAEGDVFSPAPNYKVTSYELFSLQDSCIRMTVNTGAIIKDIGHFLSEMSEGSFEVLSEDEDKYTGDYAQILNSLKTLKQSISEALSGVAIAADRVSYSTEQLSSGAQALAQASTEQASSIEELTSSMEDVSRSISADAENAENTKALSARTVEIMHESISDMDLALKSMEEISIASKNISKVIKAIDDIAFQTNILALNAAVEAARAGDAGKGFAVVADEVRNLSQKSAEAAKETAVLIENSIQAVEKGAAIMNKTSASFTEVASKSMEVGTMVDDMTDQARTQAAAISQIKLGIEQISSVIQINSATSEESAAESEELSAQVIALKALVAHFKLSN